MMVIMIVLTGSAKFSKAAAAEVLNVFSDKLSDKKLSDTLLSLMTSFSEVTAPGRVTSLHLQSYCMQYHV